MNIIEDVLRIHVRSLNRPLGHPKTACKADCGA